MITQERLKELLHYNPETGVFTWKVSKGPKAKSGSDAGCDLQRKRTYYKQIGIDGVRYYAHRLAWLYVHGKLPKNDIDHEDGDGLHNWINNLRDATNRENCKNRRLSCLNTSGVIGVNFDKRSGKWHARIGTMSGFKHLGYFTSIDAAIAARKAAEVKYGYHQNHGRLGVFPNPKVV